MRMFGILAMLVLAMSMAFAAPVNVTVTAGTPMTLTTAVAAGTVAAWGGNVTSVNVVINSSTLHWQGFYGNATGSLALGAGTNVFKYWTLSSLKGQVYASTSNTVDFTALNSTAATLGNVDTAFSFLSGANDAAASSGSDDSNSAFNISSYQVPANTKPTIKTRNSSGTEVWETVVLKQAAPNTAANFVFAGLIRENQMAFDGSTADFQIIVPEDSLGNLASTTYYFYGEVQ